MVAEAVEVLVVGVDSGLGEFVLSSNDERLVDAGLALELSAQDLLLNAPRASHLLLAAGVLAADVLLGDPLLLDNGSLHQSLALDNGLFDDLLVLNQRAVDGPLLNQHGLFHNALVSDDVLLDFSGGDLLLGHSFVLVDGGPHSALLLDVGLFDDLFPHDNGLVDDLFAD